MTRLPVPALLAAALALGACATVLETSSRQTVDPIVVVHGAGGDELAVSTEYGVVFLGRTVQNGRTEFTAFFGDGPAREEGQVQALGNGLYTTDAEILLPMVVVCFEPPTEPTNVRVRGRRNGVPFEIDAEIAVDPRVNGVLLLANEDLDRLTEAECGSGVFLVTPGKPLQLLGLLNGRLTLDGRRYFTAVGPDELWRLVVHRRNSDRPRKRVYRDDIL